MQVSLRIKFFIISLISGVAIFFGFSYTFNLAKDLLNEKEVDNIKNTFTIIEQEVQKELDVYKTDVKLLSNVESIQEIINIKDSEDYSELNNNEYDSTLKEISDLFLTFSRENKNFFQLRYIDEAGMEVVRVDRADKFSPAVVKDVSELQNKSDRYYFTESIGLSQGEVFISELDLNIENNEIEVPYRPVIRFATPVFSSDNRNKGIIVLNIFADSILDIIKLSPYAKTYLVDQDGYYLLNPDDASQEWGRYLNNGYKFDDLVKNKNEYENFFRTSNFFYQSNYKDSVNFYYKVDYSNIHSEKYWLITITGKNQLFFKDYNDLKNKILIQNSFIISFVVLVFIILVLQITRPVKYLRRAVDYLNLGRYDFEIPTKTKDEFGQFALKLNSLMRKIGEEEKERYEFINSASHQLRTPLSSMNYQIDILKEELLKKSKSKSSINLLDGIVADNERLVLVINDLLKYLEIGENYFANNLKIGNVKNIVFEVIESLKDDMDRKKIKVDIEINDKLLATFDERIFKEVLIQLISNAVEYSKERGSIKIMAEKQKNKVFFQINDQGIGMPKKEQIHVFDKFFRAKNAYAKKSVGSGLGLAMCKNIIKGHGGEIWFESKENVGTTFYFTIFDYRK